MNAIPRRRFVVLLPMSFASLPSVLCGRTFLPASGNQEMDRIRAAIKKSAAKGWSFVGMQRVVSDPSTLPPWSRQIRSLASRSGYVVLLQGNVLVPSDNSPRLAGKGGPANKAETPERRVQVWIIEWSGVTDLAKAQNDLQQGQMRQESHPDLIGYDSRYLVAADGDVNEGSETLLKARHELKLKAITSEN